MSLRTRVLSLVEVVLRVPPLFVIDEILKIGIGTDGEHELGVRQAIDHNFDGTNYTIISTVGGLPPRFDPFVYELIFESVLRLLFSVLGCMAALCLFILNTKYLMVAYMYLLSVGVVFVSYWNNQSTVKSVINILEDPTYNTTITTSILDNILSLNMSEITKTGGVTLIILKNYLLQSFLSFIFINIHLGPRYQFLQRILPLTFLTPSIICILPVPSKTILNHLPVFSALLPLALIKFVLWSSIIPILDALINGYVRSRNFVSNFGMSALVESEWQRLNVPEVLRTFWLLRVFENGFIFFLSGYWYINDNQYSSYYRLMKYLLITGCDTLTAVLGITSIVSYICNYIGKFFQWLLLSDDENDKNFGTVSAIVFYILALQTGLTGLEPEIRFVRLCRNFCLLFTAILHFIHNVVNPLLMSLSASHNPSIRRHLHALLVCIVLILLPIILMYYLWTTQDTSTWLLAVTAFSIEVIVKVLVSLSIYSLFLLDARRETFWEKLDDYIYYIRAFGNTVEFCFGIFLFFNGAWILLFESGSAIRAVMMCIHAYFNIWCDAKAGWSVFMKRRTAVNKIESLPEADDEQLRLLDDVCAICYQEMRSAKITKCRHFFHGVCLRKWLYVQDRCPLCHEILHAMDCDERKNQQVQQQQQPQPLLVPNVASSQEQQQVEEQQETNHNR